MPLKLSVSFHRKVGEANYGSRGASAALEVEIESALVGEPDRLREKLRSLYGLAQKAVDEELAGCGPPDVAHGNDATAGGGSTSSGHANGRRRDNTRRATASQVRALNAIADRRQLDLAGLLAERFGTRDPADLSIVEASGLIDELKGSTSNGNGGRR